MGVLMENQIKIEMLTRMVEKCDQEYEEIIARHGHGVRPSWVSADLADIGIRARRYREEIKRLQDQIEDDGFVTVHPEVHK